MSTKTFSSTVRLGDTRGFSLIEMLVVVAVMAIVAASAVPMTASGLAAYRIRNDAEAVKNLVSLAKMRAASKFTRARVYVDLAANTYRLEVFNRDNNTWEVEGAAIDTSTDVTFGFGALATSPPNTQIAIHMSDACTNDTDNVVANTSCIVFNSRGMPISHGRELNGVMRGENGYFGTVVSFKFAKSLYVIEAGSPIGDHDCLVDLNSNRAMRVSYIELTIMHEAVSSV